MSERVVVNVDGGSRGNPGPAAIAAVLTSAEGEVLASRGETIGVATNNVAEYKALLLGIELAKESGAVDVELVGDSELIVRQVQGRYKVKDGTLKLLHSEVRRALRDLESWTIRSVKREQNEAADALVNETLDAAE